MIFSSVRVSNFRSISDTGQLPLGPITLLLGRNNTGKSSLLRAMYLLQDGAEFSDRDRRIGTSDDPEIRLTYEELPLAVARNIGQRSDMVHVGDATDKTLICGVDENAYISVQARESDRWVALHRAPAEAPRNLIYPVLSGRARKGGMEQVNRDNVIAVWPHDGNIVSRVASLATGQFREAVQFRQLCRDVLGFEVDVIPGEHGQHLGIQVDRFKSIDLDAMGAGVAGVLNLIVSLCGAHGKLFLIEEPENDLHPEALKALLDAISTASDSNQFIISTHSNIVLTRLGSAPETVVLRTSADRVLPPNTEYERISSPERRIEVLQELGYELADLHLGEGWIIFEESSAERIVRQFLIPWFAPKLQRIRTVAACGTSRVEPLFQDFAEMLLFSHLEPIYRHKAWVVVDGDASGLTVVKNLREKFKQWPADRFTNWSESNFEKYYPASFADAVDHVLSVQDKKVLRERKKDLLNRVLQWIEANPEEARRELESSASEVIEYLRKVELEISTSREEC